MVRSPANDNDAGSEVCPIELDRVTRERLVRVATESGVPPLQLAAMFLREMLQDDDRENGNTTPVHGVFQ